MGQSLKTANRKAAEAADLAAIDKLGSDRNLYDATLSAIEDAALNFVSRVKNNLETNKMVVTGGIEDISITQRGSDVLIYGKDYLLYQDKGVNGSKIKLYNTPFTYREKRPPVSAFLEYVKTKNLQLRNESKYRKDKKGSSPFESADTDELQEALAYKIREKVFREGFKPRRVYSKELPQLVRDIKEKIPSFSAKQVSQQLGDLPPQKIKIKL